MYVFQENGPEPTQGRTRWGSDTLCFRPSPRSASPRWRLARRLTRAAGGGRDRQRRHRRRGARARAGRKPACGSSRRRPSCRPSSPRWSSPTTRAATSSRTCRPRTTRSGCAATGSSIRRRCAASPASSSISRRCRRQTSAPAAHYYPAIYWYTMMKMPPEKDFGGTTDIPKNITRETLAPAHGQRRLHRLPSARTGIDAHHPGAVRAVQVGRRGVGAAHRLRPHRRVDGEPAAPDSSAACRSSISAIGPTASPRASCRSTSRRGRTGVERNVVVTSWEWGTEKTFLHDLISSDRRNPTVNAYGPLFGSPEYSSDDIPILDPKTHKVTFFKMPVARSERAGIVRAAVPCSRPCRSRRRPRPIGATRRSGASAPTTTTACSTRRAGCGSRRPCAASRIRPSARRARTIPRPRCSRSTARDARCRCSIPRR